LVSLWPRTACPKQPLDGFKVTRNFKNSLNQITQHNSLNILLYENGVAKLPEPERQILCGPKRTFSYYFVYITEGSGKYFVDDTAYDVFKGQLLVVIPHQIYFSLKPETGFDYIKLIFDDDCLSLLPVSYSFIGHSLDNPVTSFTEETCHRMLMLFQLLKAAMQTPAKNAELILSYLHPFLTEIEQSYVKKNVPQANNKFNREHFLKFRNTVEREFKEASSVRNIAQKMAISTDSLNRLVTEFTGSSSKSYINARIILEAKRMLFHYQTPVKDLAYTLGFSDPDYFSRFFKKQVGQSISDYLKKMQYLSS
jgi:AraC family transcriptional activator of pobA